MYRFTDRREAGRMLARKLMQYQGRPNLLVLALPRGGVPVGFEVAKALSGELDVLLVRKLGAPGYEELAMGALASGNIQVLNDDVIRMMRITEDEVEAVVRAEEQELNRRERQYRDDRPAPAIAGRTVILVDDGLATGSTMRAAATAVRAQKPQELVIGVPVGARETCQELRSEADAVFCVMTPEPFDAVGLWYDDFSQTEDEEVRQLLQEATRFKFREDSLTDADGWREAT